MTTCLEDGWGIGWGNTPWGGATDSVLRIVGAVAIAENIVRVQFGVAPIFTRTLELGDASDAARWGVALAADSPRGMDGLPLRPVTPIEARLAVFAGADGRYVDVVVDRPFSPFPARYLVSAVGLLSVDGFALDPCASSREFAAVFKTLVPISPEYAISNADIANPMNLSATLDPFPDPLNPKLLGTISVGDSGDYQVDQGPVNFRKRCLRRLISVKGSYAQDPNYGVSTPQAIKHLGRPAMLIALAKEAESQIALEPETDQVRARVDRDYNAEGLFLFRVLVKSKDGDFFKLLAPVPNGVTVTF